MAYCCHVIQPFDSLGKEHYPTTAIKMSLLYVFVIFVGLGTIETFHIFIHICVKKKDKQTKDCARLRSSQHKQQHRCFYP